MMWFAQLKNCFGQIENDGRKIVKQIKENRVTPSVANFCIWHPNDCVARIGRCARIQNVTEFGQSQRIRFARRTVNYFGCGDRTRAHIPAHCNRWIYDVITRNDVNDGLWIAGNGAEDALYVASQQTEVTTVGVADPALHGMIVCSIHCNDEDIIIFYYI